MCDRNFLRFPNFVANACCNPCCENFVTAQRVESVASDSNNCQVCIVPCCCGCGCGCGNVGGSSNNCGCGCDNVGGSFDDDCDRGCDSVGGSFDDDCDCGCDNVGGSSDNNGCGCGNHRRRRR